jgi:hypothetical protein
MGLEKRDIALVLVSTPQYSRQRYLPIRHIMEDIEKGYKVRNIFILTDSQAATKLLNNYQIYSKLVWDCYQFLVKMAERNNPTGMGARTYVN